MSYCLEFAAFALQWLRRTCRQAASGVTACVRQAEVIHRQSWRTREALEWATLEWVDCFNHKCLLGPIGHIPPAEAEANYYRQQAGQAMAA